MTTGCSVGTKPIVIIESPYAGDVARNKAYLQECIRDCLARGEVPLASHQMYTDALDDGDAEQREQGIEAGYALWDIADRIVFYEDLGYSDGMSRARKRVLAEDKPFIRRFLNKLPGVTQISKPPPTPLLQVNVKAFSGSVGFNPMFGSVVLALRDRVVLEPGRFSDVATQIQEIEIPVGVRADFAEQYGGVEATGSVVVHGGLRSLDAGRHAEVRVLLANHGDAPVTLLKGAPVARLVLTQVAKTEIKEGGQ